MKIDFGPPAVAGVKHLQYLSGEDDADYTSLGLHALVKPVGAIALGTWGFAWVTKNQPLKRQALAVAVGAFIMQFLTRP